ncbi:MAG: TAXI family TRAP transporter solute-binding subunit [Hyphomicrobiales bacterium]|nr:TAXI family TRAP transporter solute-binding subunit [Hyphomicrobiales bacterium]
MTMNSIRNLGVATASLTLFAGAAMAQPVSLSTLPPGAINNVQAQVVAKVLQQKGKMNVRVATYNSPSNILGSVNTNRSEFAWTSNDEAGAALRGTQEYKGKQMKNLRVAATIFHFNVGILVKDDGPVKTLQDLKKYPTATGWKGFTQGKAIFDAMLATAGMSLADVKPSPSLNLITAANDLKAGKNMATIFAVGAPKVAELNSAMDGVRFISLDHSPEALKKMQAVRPEYYLGKVEPAKFRPGIKGPTWMAQYHIIVVTNPKVKDDVVYNLAKTLYGAKKELAAGHPSFRATDPKNFGMNHGDLKYHPGAIKFLKEVGVWKG